MLAMPHIVLVGLLAASPADGLDPQVAQTAVERDARVEVVATPPQTIRGRIAELTTDTVVVDTHDGRVTVPMQSVQSISRVGDSVANGTAIGAAIGGVSTLGLLAKLCANSNCSDTSSNLDPRFTLLGTLIGAGIGALVDGLIERRTPVYRADPDQSPVLAPPSQPQRPPGEVMLFARAGGGQLNDDEGSLGSGGTWGTGVRVPIGRRMALQAAYDRQNRRRDFEFGRNFTGTETLFTGKLLWSFRTEKPVRPYVGLGLGVMNSRSRSDSPTWTLGPRNQVIQGPIETSESRSRSTMLGLAVGADVRLYRCLSVVGDITLDMRGRQAFSSTRLTLGAGWRF